MAAGKKMKNFDEKVYKLLQKIPYGKVSTYKQIAAALKNSKECRAVGNALNRNKEPDKIPCFKIVKSDGSLGGFSRGVKDKIKRLKKEGIKVKNNKIANFDKLLFRYY